MERHCDIYHVAESVKRIKKNVEIELGDSVELLVWNKEAIMKAISRNEMDRRNIDRGEYVDLVCTLEIESVGLIRLKFHEKVVQNEFRFFPVGPHAIDPQQATQPGELGEILRMVTNQLNYAFDIHRWDFSKIDGASIANGGYITDYEFEYEAFI